MLEWNEHGDFELLREFCRAKSGKDGCWSLLGVDYFSNAGSRQLADCMSRRYSRILIDYGLWDEGSSLEGARCDRRILLGSLSEWQAGRFADLIRAQGRADKSRSYGTVFGSEEARLAVERELHTAVRRIPFSADAFAVTGTDMQFFRTWRVLA